MWVFLPLVLGLLLLFYLCWPTVRNNGFGNVNEKMHQMAGSAITIVSELPEKENWRAGLSKEKDFGSLLTEFELTGSFKYLKRAAELFPNEPEVIIQMALFADSPDSEWIEKLEAIQPGNALPHLIRASLYAENSQVERFAEEMEVVIAKGAIDTNFRNRLSRIIDDMLETGRFPSEIIGDGSLGSMDKEFFQKVGRINTMFRNEEIILDDSEATNALALAWAKNMQSLPGLDLLNQHNGTWLEAEILQRYDDGDLYGTNGLTVGMRRSELRSERDVLYRKLVKYNEVLLTDRTDSAVKRQFLSRVQSDGEMAAVNWLITQ